MTEQEKEFAGKTAQYQQELKYLQHLLEDKQETLNEVLQQKRYVIGRSNPIRYNREKGVGGSQLCTAEGSCFPPEPQTVYYFLVPVIAIMKMLKYS